jgi:hypothetical protein
MSPRDKNRLSSASKVSDFLNGKGSPDSSFLRWVSYVFGDEVLQQEPQNRLEVGPLSDLLVLDCTDLGTHFRLRESETANHFADAVACRPDSRLVVVVSPRPIVNGGRQASEVARDLYLFTRSRMTNVRERPSRPMTGPTRIDGYPLLSVIYALFFP